MVCVAAAAAATTTTTIRTNNDGKKSDSQDKNYDKRNDDGKYQDNNYNYNWGLPQYIFFFASVEEKNKSLSFLPLVFDYF